MSRAATRYASRSALPALAMAALLPAVVSALSLPGGFESSEHSFAMDEGAPRECDAAQRAACLAEHEACLLFDGHAADKPSACACATQLYGVCLRAAGCAAAAMPECVARLLAQECGDMSVCGSNCYTDDELLPGAGDDAARVLPVNNFGADYLRFSVCDKSYDQHMLDAYSMVVMERCDAASFKVCDYWIPPATFTALAIHPNSTYVMVEKCIFVAAEDREDGRQADGDRYKCLPEDRKEYYGSRVHWPSSIDVEFSEAPRCESNGDCPGSYCDRTLRPPICAPKNLDQVTGDADGYMTPRAGAG